MFCWNTYEPKQVGSCLTDEQKKHLDETMTTYAVALKQLAGEKDAN